MREGERQNPLPTKHPYHWQQACGSRRSARRVLIDPLGEAGKHLPCQVRETYWSLEILRRNDYCGEDNLFKHPHRRVEIFAMRAEIFATCVESTYAYKEAASTR